MTEAPTLEATGIDVEAGGRLILEDVSCSVRPGTVTALVGPNGAGKSTLMRILAGIAPPKAGSVRYGERDWFAIGRRERARIAALVEQDSATESPMTVSAAVALGRTPHAGIFSAETPADHAAIEKAMQAAEVDDLALRSFSSLSGGERQRVHLARAFAQEPQLLLLDEPTNHLDVRAQLSVLTLLRKRADDSDLGVLAALHDLNLAASFADWVVMLANGRVVGAGKPAEILTAELIASVYGVEATVIPHPKTGSPLIAFSVAEKSDQQL
jgi:iron complex transport system ATP-binding protein